MPEIKSLGLDRSLGLGVNTYAIAFADSAREKKRQEMMAERKISASKIREDRIAKKKRNEAWSNKHDQEHLQEARRSRKKRRMEAKRVAKMTPEELEERRQLDALLAEVRKQNRDAANDGAKGTADFEGFAD
jgi:ATP-dependent RNA helicase DDX55/SPB4